MRRALIDGTTNPASWSTGSTMKFAKTVAEFKKKAMDLDGGGISLLAVEIQRRLEKQLKDPIRMMDRKMADNLCERI